nr:glycosyl hydrolase family 28-related protein [Motilibacter aurantiacus]
MGTVTSTSSTATLRSIALPAGTLTLTNSFSGSCRTLRVDVPSLGLSTTGPTGSKLVGQVPAGALTVKVTGQKCNATAFLGITVTPTPAAAAPAANVKNVLSYGAVGDGVTDDTAAIYRAIDALAPGDTLQFPQGRTFVHKQIIKILKSNIRLAGKATLLATDPMSSDVVIESSNVTVEDLTFKTVGATVRNSSIDQMGLTLGMSSGTVLRRVTVDGPSAAGIFVVGARDFLIEDAVVQNSLSDGIHVTHASQNGRIVRPTIRNSGDDGVGIVSYLNDGAPVRNVTVTSPRFYGNTWGRAFSVVGGEDISYTDVYAERSAGAAVYIGAEGAPWNTFTAKRVTVSGGTLVGSNTVASVDHGAILVLPGSKDRLEDVTIKNLLIKDTRATASRQVGLYLPDEDAVAPARVSFLGLTVEGGNEIVFWTNAPRTSYALTGTTWNRTAVAGNEASW